MTLETEASLPQVGKKKQGGAEESTLNNRSTHSMDSGEVESSKAERKARKTIRKQKAKDQLEDEARTLALEALKKEVGDNIIMAERGESKKARKEERKAKRKEEERVEAAMESSTLESNLPSKSMQVEEVQQKATRPTKVKKSKKPKSIPLDDVTPPADVAVSIEKSKRKKMANERGKGKERGVEDDDDDEEVNSKKKKRKSAAIVKPTKIMKKTALSKRMIVDSDDEDHDIIGTEDEEETAGEVKTIRRSTKRPPPIDIASLTNFDVLTTRWMTASQLRAIQVERGESGNNASLVAKLTLIFMNTLQAPPLPISKESSQIKKISPSDRLSLTTLNNTRWTPSLLKPYFSREARRRETASGL